MITVLVGKSASGKNTIQNQLVERYGFGKIVTYTTRPPRNGEIEGEDYHFISEEEFVQKEKEIFFMETCLYHASYGDVQYGSRRIDYIVSPTHENRVLILNPHGVKAVMDEIGDGYYFDSIRFIYLDVVDDVLLQRLHERGDDPQEISRRMEADKKDFEWVEKMCLAGKISRIDASYKSIEDICQEIIEK